VVSALLFRGTASRLVALWQSRRITVLISGPILEEYVRVLAYPSSASATRRSERWSRKSSFRSSTPSACDVVWPSFKRDPDDDKFLECAVTGRASFLVTGDRDLRELESFRGTTILTAGEFLQRLRA
jgi:predicted nucleic acid-binding protein